MDLRTKIRPKGTQSSPNSILCQIKRGYLYTKMVVFNGRVGYAFAQKGLVVIDLFYGQTKSFPLPVHSTYCRPIEFVNEECFLLFDYSQPKLYLFKIDLDELVLTELCSIQFDNCFKYGDLLVDQSNLGKFVLYYYGDKKLHTGSVADDQIVFEEAIKPGDYFEHGVLNDSKISAMYVVDSSPCCFKEFDLKAKQLTSHEVPTEFSNEEAFNLNFSHIYAWSGCRFYIAYENNYDIYKIAAFDTETFKWTYTGVKILDWVQSISVDQDEILTVVAGGFLDSTTTVYRYPLKKPDTLVNLAWFASTRRFKATGEQGNLPIPLNRDIRLIFPMNKKPKYQTNRRRFCSIQ